MMQFHWSISILLLIILLLLPVVWWLLGKNTGKKLPPARAGWLPWIGVAYEFGKSPLLYIDEARKEVNDVISHYN
jgi:24-hydroxycholesterol 7alpha-hydroxylase